MPDNSLFISSALSSVSAGQNVTFNYGHQLYACYYGNGADVGSRTAFQAPLSGSTNVNLTLKLNSDGPVSAFCGL